MTNEFRLRYLLEQIIEARASAAESAELLQMLASEAGEEVMAYMDTFYQARSRNTPHSHINIHYWQLAAQEVLAVDKLPAVAAIKRKPVLRSLYRWVAAAIIVLAVAAAWLISTSKTHLSNPATHSVASVSPGRNGAILTLANGSQVVLDSLGNGEIAQATGSTITLQNHQLIYKNIPGHATPNPGNPAMNTLSTPRGRQFQLSFPDGSKVWLNAASSISYPVAFTGTNREVQLTGEAYFEIAPNVRQPFYVKTGNLQLRVLGTSFNMMAYAEEGAVETTLLSGAVQLETGARRVQLKPGEQAILNNSEFKIKEADTDGAIAWKNGYFQFNKAGLPVIMRQLSRWYDVDIVYEGKPTKELFGGQIKRGASIEQVLHILELKKVHFTIQGRKIMVKS